MEIVDVRPELLPAWNSFVERHPMASYGHLSAQFSLSDATPGVRNLSMAAVDRGRLLAIVPLFASGDHVLRRIPIREVASGTFFPAGPLVSSEVPQKDHGKILSLLMEAVRHRAAAAGADRVVITHPNVVDGQPSIARLGYSPMLHYGYTARPGIGLLLNLDQDEAALAAGRQSGCGRWIKKAVAAGAVVDVITDRERWMGCYDLNVQTLGTLAYTRAQLAAAWDAFIEPGFATAHAVTIDGVTMSVIVTVHFNGSAYYWLGFNRKPASVPGTGHLALWSAVLGARAKGFRHYELGSLDFGNPKNMGISQFKQSFGGTPYQIISAQLDMRPVKTAALGLATAVVDAVRQRRRAPAPPPKPQAVAPESAPAAAPATAPVSAT